MKQVSTVCARDCYDTCSLVVTLDEEDKIVSVRGDSKHPVTQGIVCPRGAKDAVRLYQNRVERPSLRQGDRFVDAEWETGLDTVARRLGQVLDEHGPQAVLHLDYAGNMGLLTSQFPRRLWNCIGATQTDGAVCSKSGHVGLGLHYGASYGVDPVEIASMDMVVFWGFNAAASSPHMWALARRARQLNGAKIVAVDPRGNRTAQSADLWIRPRPGSDVALAYGLINYLIESGLLDRDFIAEWTLGFEQLREEAARWTPDRVEQVTGVSWRDVEQLADAYANLKPSATLIGIGLQKCDQGADQVRTVGFIPALVGLHRGFFYANASSFSVDNSLISGQALTTRVPKTVSQVALAELVKDGEFKFIYVNCMNPALTLPNQRAFRDGVSRPDVFLVVHETHWTKTADYADVVLPAPTYLEKTDVVIPWGHNFVRRSERVVRPITDSREGTWVMQEIARRLGLTEEWLYQDPWSIVERTLEDAFQGADLGALESGEFLALRTKPKQEYQTPSGKIEFFSSVAAEHGFSPLPIQAPMVVDLDSFVFLQSATSRYTSTQFQEVYGPIPAVVTINPRDAARLNVEEGASVALANERGQVRMRVAISDAVPEGVVWAPRQGEGLDGEPVNCLTSSSPQEIGGGARYNSTRVTISRH